MEVPIPMTQEEIVHWAPAPFDEHVVEASVDELFCATALGPPVPIGPKHRNSQIMFTGFALLVKLEEARLAAEEY